MADTKTSKAGRNLPAAIAVSLLLGGTVIATLIAHRFWDYPDPQRAMQQIQFMKNLAVIGGLVLVVGCGGGRYALDRGR